VEKRRQATLKRLAEEEKKRKEKEELERIAREKAMAALRIQIQ
jgi:hypothetical protein